MSVHFCTYSYERKTLHHHHVSKFSRTQFILLKQRAASHIVYACNDVVWSSSYRKTWIHVDRIKCSTRLQRENCTSENDIVGGEAQRTKTDINERYQHLSVAFFFFLELGNQFKNKVIRP